MMKSPLLMASKAADTRNMNSGQRPGARYARIASERMLETTVTEKKRAAGAVKMMCVFLNNWSQIARQGISYIVKHITSKHLRRYRRGT